MGEGFVGTIIKDTQTIMGGWKQEKEVGVGEAWGEMAENYLNKNNFF